ncbi:ATP-binding protein [Granulosicoccus sp. 3-233]|uniref:ATP-binding protein n=1 Tax=Granulosicoccus sp. 3-233 TaxID=3417969 RepID=UPI003D3388FC
MKLTRGVWRELDTLLLAAASVLAIGAVVMLFNLNKELSVSRTIFNDDLPSFSVRAEFDLAMLVSEINEFIQGEKDAEEMWQRYEVLIARLSHYEAAFLTEYSDPDPEFHAIIEELTTRVLAFEESFYALRPGDVSSALQLRNEFKGMRPQLATLSNLTRHHQFLQYQKIDESLAHSAFVGTLMLASTLILGALTMGRFWYSLREKTRFSEELEAKIQLRTRDLQLSNSELKKEIAERQKAEKNLAERDRQMHHVQKMEAVGRITAGVAHDFNNLLAVIMGNIELQMNLGENRHPARFLDNALSASIMGSQLTRKLLAFGRRSPLKPEMVDLNRVVSELNDLFMQTISEKNTLETILTDDLRPICVDRSLLENVVLNLVINARDALPDGGIITIRTENVRLEHGHSESDGRLMKAGDYVQLTVSDIGSGMSAEVLEQAIEPFFTTKSESEGSGLGLSMAYGFVQQSNGQMRVDSKLGEGTSVQLIFPTSDSPECPAASTMDSMTYEPNGRTLRVLVAEDSEAVRKTVVKQLQLLGCSTVEAGSGHEAHELIKADSSIDLLLTDVVMPGSMQGPELAEQVLQLYPGMKVVFMSGYPKGMDQSVDGPNNRFTKLMKPISLGVLSQTLRQEFEVDPAHESL